MDAVLDGDRICWFPVRHFSVACAWHLNQVIEALEPAAVLVEGPDDATPLIPALVADDTEAPVSILSTWLDRKDEHGMAGVLSSSPSVPVRYRGWWPMVDYAPEMVALRAGTRVGAELAFIDAPLRATVPFNHVPNRASSTVARDRNLIENAYFDRLRRRARVRDFGELWDGMFEVRGLHGDTLAFMRAVLTFAWCTRHAPGAIGLEQDGSLLREAHMRWHVDEMRKRTEGWIVVVTGAFHAVALPWTKGKRARAKADRYTQTVLCAHSFPALARLYGHNRFPAHGQAVWNALSTGSTRPHDDAVSALLVEVMREARRDGLPVSTADAVGAWTVAGNLAGLRGHPEPTRYDLQDAAQMAYIKGDLGGAGALLDPVVQRVLVGGAVGSVSAMAGEIPLLGDFYAQAKAHRIDVSGAHKIVRCNLGREVAHRRKSAFLHRADFLEIPMFASADRNRRTHHFKGPDPIRGEDMHLITETWGIRWREEVDAALMELSDRGSSLAEVAALMIREQLDGARNDAEHAAELVLRAAHMMLGEVLGPALQALADALALDTRFLTLCRATNELVLLYELRQGLTSGVEQVLDVLELSWRSAVLQIPQAALVSADDARDVVNGLKDLVRIGIGFQARDLDLEQLQAHVTELHRAEVCNPTVRGAAAGVLHGLGILEEARIADELSLISRGSGAEQAGAYLEGVLLAGKGVLLGRGGLLEAIDEVLCALDWETFRRVLPDLRRAFTELIPSELDRLGARVAVLADPELADDLDGPVPTGLVAQVAELDTAARDAFVSWAGSFGMDVR